MLTPLPTANATSRLDFCVFFNLIIFMVKFFLWKQPIRGAANNFNIASICESVKTVQCKNTK